MKTEQLLCFITAFTIFGAGCSFKKPDDKKSGSTREEFKINPNQDSDGDGKTDLDERKTGENPLIADVPTFQGDFFQEMKVTTHFYNSAANTQEAVSFQVRKDVVRENGTPIEERDFLDKGREFLFEQSHLLANKNSYRGFHYPTDFSIEDIGYHAPPRMNDLKIFPFSQKVFYLSQKNDFEEMDFVVSNRINFKYHGAKTYTDLVVDLFWFDNIKMEFILVGTDFLKGVYQFNQDYTVPLTFSSNIKPLVKEISENGGRFLYIKIRDFKIIETGQFYMQILSSVSNKSIPVLFSDEEKDSIVYVGTNGRTSGLHEILGIALKDDVQVLNSKIVRIGDRSESVSIERDPYGASESVEKKWHLLTNEISNSPFTYSFAPTDLITLSYISGNRPFALIPSYFGTVISSEKPRDLKTVKIKTSNLLDMRLNFRPQEVTVPVNKVLQVFPCHQTPLAKSCFEYSYKLEKLKGIQALQVTSLVYVTLNGTEFRLDKLLDEKLASFRVKNSEVIEIKFNSGILSKSPESTGTTISFSTKITSIPGCTGIKICESSGDGCNRFLASPPTCEDAGSNTFYNLHDQTLKTLHPVNGEAFFSIEYI